MRKLGQSTLTEAEMRTEARRHLNYLQDRFEGMTQSERTFVEQRVEAFKRFSDRAVITPNQLFWLRDLAEKY